MNPSTPQLSIVIPVFNQLHYTEKCVESLLQHTQSLPFQLIIVDNASTDGTSDYLTSLAPRLHSAGVQWTPILNQKNLGVAPAWNQGLRACKADEITILNNDILVTENWVEGLRHSIQKHHLALSCPYAINGALDYDLNTRSRRFTRRNKNRIWEEYSFCAFYMPRSTFDQIGFFDEGFLIGGFEDNDYCYRIKKAGLRYGVTGASFVHHFGSATLGEFKKTGDRHEAPNRAYFVKKWGFDPSAKINTPAARLRRATRKIKIKLDWM